MAEQMNGFVQELVELVDGYRNGNGRAETEQIANQPQPPHSQKQEKVTTGEEHTPAVPVSSGRIVSPDKVIPLDGDFQDF